MEGIRSRKNETEAFLTNSVIDIIKGDLQLPNVTVYDVDKFTGLDQQIMMVSKTSS